VKVFMKRHPTLTIRTTSMIKRARAAVSSKVVENFFKRFTKTADICNYDESGLKDNLGVDMAIFKKGVKHAEQNKEITQNPRSALCSAERLPANLFRRMPYKRQTTVGRVGDSVVQMVLDTPLLLQAGLRALHSQTGSKRFCFQMPGNFEVELKQN
jgi:hypothetical protein